MRAPPSGPAASASCSQPASLWGLKSPPPSSEGPRWGSSPSLSPAWRFPLAWEGKTRCSDSFMAGFLQRPPDSKVRTNQSSLISAKKNDEQHSQCFPLCYFSPWEDINSSLGERHTYRENSVCSTAIHFSLVSIPFNTVYIRTTFYGHFSLLIRNSTTFMFQGTISKSQIIREGQKFLNEHLYQYRRSITINFILIESRF